MRRWDGILENYLRKCEISGLAKGTIEGKERELRRWGNWLKRRKPKPKLEEIRSDLIIDYIRSRTAFHAKCTVYRVISNMRCMGEFLVQEGLWKQNPLKWIRGPKLDPRSKLPRRIGKENLKKIWIEAMKIRKEYQRLLWTCVLAILYGTGIRRGELERLKLCDWKSEDKVLKIDGSKAGRERHLPLPEVSWKFLEAYLPLRYNLLMKYELHDENFLLISGNGKRLSGKSIGCKIHRLAKKARVSLVSMHQFRHTCASDLLEEGVGLVKVQQILGHACISSTYRYTHISDPERKKAMQLHPINNILKSNGLKGGQNG